jgi:chromosome partitioning protein
LVASPEQMIAEAPSPVDPMRRIPPATAQDIEMMAGQAAEILKEAVAAAIEPEQRKTLRKWNLKEVSELLGLSRKTLERGIEDGKLPGGERVATGRRLFSLEEIHKIQEALGLRPWRDPATDPPIVIAVANFKGGVAKTSTAIHLGQYFALRGYRTLMIDIDAQGSLTTLFGLRPDADVPIERTLTPWFRGPGVDGSNEEWTGTLATAIQPTYWHGLDLIAANLQLYGSEFALASRQAREPNFRFYRVLADGIATISDRYDVIVIDTPPSLTFLTTNAIYAANGIVMPVPPAMMDFASSVSFFQLLSELVQVTNQNEAAPKRYDFLGLLISKYEPKNPTHLAIHDWLRAAFARRVLVNTMSMTTILRIGADIKTAYEIERYEGDRRTLARALEYLNGVNGEIEAVVRAQWPSKSVPASKPTRARMAVSA